MLTTTEKDINDITARALTKLNELYKVQGDATFVALGKDILELSTMCYSACVRLANANEALDSLRQSDTVLPPRKSASTLSTYF